MAQNDTDNPVDYWSDPTDDSTPRRKKKTDPVTGLPVDDYEDPAQPSDASSGPYGGTMDPSAKIGSLSPKIPKGGNINDPSYLDQLLAYYGRMPGANPSVANDPDYWRQAVASGRFKGDENYLIQRFMTPEGPPEGTASSSTGGDSSSAASPTSQSELSAFLQKWMESLVNAQSETARQRQGILDRLNALADQYSKPVSADDPNISASTQAYTGNVNRAVNDFQRRAAERAYAEGTTSGAFDSQIQNAVMQGGRSIGDFETGLMRDEMLSRRQSLMDVLNQSGSLLSAQDAADIQQKIAAVDAALKGRGIDVSETQGKDSLNLQKLLGLGSLDLQRVLGLGSLDLQRLLGTGNLANQNLSITNQNKQFYDRLGLDTANSTSSLDQILAALLLRGR